MTRPYLPPTVRTVGSLADLTLAWEAGIDEFDDQVYVDFGCSVDNGGKNHPIVPTGDKKGQPNSFKPKPECQNLLIGSS